VRKLSEREASSVFLKAGLRPLEPFPGARFKWKAECLECGHVYSPNFYSIKSGRRCANCFKLWQATEQRKKGLEAALKTCKSLNYELASEYVNAKTKVDLKCLVCGNHLNTTLDVLQSGGKKCACRKTARKLLSEYRPDIFREIDWENTQESSPTKIGTGSRRVISWTCQPKGHHFKTSPANRIRNNGTCPICAGVTPETGVNDLQTLFPKIASEFFEDPHGQNNPSTVFPKSNLKFVWKCSINKRHVWKTQVQNRVEGTSCPFCANKKVLPGDNDFATSHPKLVAEWDEKKNGNLDPTKITAGSNKVVYWICNQGHSWRAAVITRCLRGSGCMKCYHFEPGRNDLGTLGSKILISEFDTSRNGLKVSEIGISSATKYWWLCSLCGSSFKSSVINRHFNNTGCPNCASTGYSPLKPSTLYFIENKKLNSRKIGKTNTSNSHDRIGKFMSKGWTLINKWERTEGYSVDFVEAALLNWIRTEKNLPQHLDRGAMRGLAGETETFSIEGVGNEEVINTGEALFNSWNNPG
jgi:hypothetical protein